MFSPAQVEQLLRPVNPRRVQRNDKGMSHLAAYDVSAHLTRIFGFGGWRKEILSLDLVAEDGVIDKKRERIGWYVTYRCTMRLYVGDWWNDDGATGSASNLPDRGDAHDFAAKNAISYALKRCAKDLGDQFGLSLYNKGSTDPLVIRTLTAGLNSATAATAGVERDLPDLAPDWDEAPPPEREDGRRLTGYGLTRTGVPDADLDANGEMTREQAREHRALAPVRGEQPPVQRLAAVPDADPWYDTGQPPAEPDERDYDSPGTITRAQQSAMHAKFAALGVTDRAERLAVTIDTLKLGGQDVAGLKSSSDLSRHQAGLLLEALEELARAK